MRRRVALVSLFVFVLALSLTSAAFGDDNAIGDISYVDISPDVSVSDRVSVASSMTLSQALADATNPMQVDVRDGGVLTIEASEAELVGRKAIINVYPGGSLRVAADGGYLLGVAPGEQGAIEVKTGLVTVTAYEGGPFHTFAYRVLGAVVLHNAREFDVPSGFDKVEFGVQAGSTAVVEGSAVYSGDKWLSVSGSFTVLPGADFAVDYPGLVSINDGASFVLPALTDEQFKRLQCEFWVSRKSHFVYDGQEFLGPSGVFSVTGSLGGAQGDSYVQQIRFHTGTFYPNYSAIIVRSDPAKALVSSDGVPRIFSDMMFVGTQVTIPKGVTWHILKGEFLSVFDSTFDVSGEMVVQGAVEAGATCRINGNVTVDGGVVKFPTDEPVIEGDAVYTIAGSGRVYSQVDLGNRVVGERATSDIDYYPYMWKAPALSIDIIDLRGTGAALSTDEPIAVEAGGAAKVVADAPDEVSAGTVVARMLPDGTFEPIAKSSVRSGEASFIVGGDEQVMLLDNTKEFSDIKGREWFVDVAAEASAKGILNGVNGTQFQGDGAMSRAMVATVLQRLEKGDVEGAATAFGDVPAGAWYSDGVAWAAEAGIVQGYGNGSFKPSATVSREQLVLMMQRYANLLGMDTSERADLDAFKDANALTYGKEAMSWAVAQGLVGGVGDTGMLAPTKGATRAETCAIILRFIELML